MNFSTDFRLNCQSIMRRIKTPRRHKITHKSSKRVPPHLTKLPGESQDSVQHRLLWGVKENLRNSIIFQKLTYLFHEHKTRNYEITQHKIFFQKSTHE